VTGDASDAKDDHRNEMTSTADVATVEDAATLAGSADPPWSVVDTEVVWENPYFTAGYDVVEGPDGSANRWYWVDPADVVAVVAEADGEVVLVDQPDGRLGRSVLTVPGGGVEDGESFVEAGRRELREETGFGATEVELLRTYYPSAWARMEQAVVYATGLEPGTTDRDTGEVLDVYTAPPDVALDAVANRSPAFGPGLTSLLLARRAGRV
jgi:ADP-ribose pyrophosphatase